MMMADKLGRNLASTQIVGSAIQATLFVLPVAKGVFYLSHLAGFDGLAETRTSVLAVVGICWLLLFLPGPQGHWPAFSRAMADPTLSVSDKIKAMFTNWFSLLMIIATLTWLAGAKFSGAPILP
jgi:hypothetical protein